MKWLEDLLQEAKEKYDERYKSGMPTDYYLGQIHAYEEVFKRLKGG